MQISCTTCSLAAVHGARLLRQLFHHLHIAGGLCERCHRMLQMLPHMLQITLPPLPTGSFASMLRRTPLRCTPRTAVAAWSVRQPFLRISPRRFGGTVRRPPFLEFVRARPHRPELYHDRGWRAPTGGKNLKNAAQRTPLRTCAPDHGERLCACPTHPAVDFSPSRNFVKSANTGDSALFAVTSR